MSWHAQSGQDLSFGDVVPDDSPQANVRTEALRIIIKAKADVQLSEALAINSSLTKAEAYSESDLMNVSLNFTNSGTTVQAISFQLFQNQPNPFKANTTIGFQLPEAGEVTLEVFEVSEKLIHLVRANYAPGFHQIDLSRANLSEDVLFF